MSLKKRIIGNFLSLRRDESHEVVEEFGSAGALSTLSLPITEINSAGVSGFFYMHGVEGSGQAASVRVHFGGNNGTFAVGTPEIIDFGGGATLVSSVSFSTNNLQVAFDTGTYGVNSVNTKYWLKYVRAFQ